MKELTNPVSVELAACAARALRPKFRSDLFVRLPGFARGSTLHSLRREALASLLRGQRRDLEMPTSGNSARKMHTVSGQGISASGPSIPKLYHHPFMRRFLTELTGTKVLRLRDHLENFVVNVLDQVGDEHGEHVDEFPFAFNILLIAPPDGVGGQLEFVRTTRLGRKSGHEVVRPRLVAGDAYIMRADRVAHLVTPLQAPARRLILSMAYADETSAERQQCSSQLLYGSA